MDAVLRRSLNTAQCPAAAALRPNLRSWESCEGIRDGPGLWLESIRTRSPCFQGDNKLVPMEVDDAAWLPGCF
jgi:hypothetical protein